MMSFRLLSFLAIHCATVLSAQEGVRYRADLRDQRDDKFTSDHRRVG